MPGLVTQRVMYMALAVVIAVIREPVPLNPSLQKTKAHRVCDFLRVTLMGSACLGLAPVLPECRVLLRAPNCPPNMVVDGVPGTWFSACLLAGFL